MIHTARQSAKFIRLVRKLRAEFGSIPIDTETIAVGILEAVVAFHNGQHTTAKEITKSIRCKFGRPNHIFAANVYLIGSPWESDLVSITPAHYYTEFEIKVSRADYNADFRKRAFSTSKHDILQNKVETTPMCEPGDTSTDTQDPSNSISSSWRASARPRTCQNIAG